MPPSEPKAGVRAEHLVIRHLKLSGVEPASQATLLADIEQAYGVEFARFEPESSTLHVAYDATHCSIDGIEDLIQRHGAEVAHTWWTQLKEDVYRFLDANIQENARQAPRSRHWPGEPRRRTSDGSRRV